MIVLMGGEPLLYKGIDSIVDFVKSEGMQCHLTTNGILIPQFIGLLKKVDLLMVSLDGQRYGHEKNRGEGTWQKVIDGIELAKSYGIPLRINAVMTRNNKEDMAWLLDFGSKHKAYVGFTIPAKCPKVDMMADLILTDEEQIEIHRKLLEFKKMGKKITLSTDALNHVIRYPRKLNEIVYKRDVDNKRVYPNECPYGRYIVFIGADSSVYPCTTLWERPSEYVPKNILKDGFEAAIKNAQELPCWICACAGGVEWSKMTGFRGIPDAVRFTLSQRKEK
jgi:MoaA/NifB/PqqE/SkfB family radical SAM enzyme